MYRGSFESYITNIRPNILKRNIVVSKVVDHIHEFSPVRITPSALMISKSEVLLHYGLPNGAKLILFGNFRWRWAGKEVQINAASKGAPGDAIIAKEHFLTVGVTKINTMRVGHVRFLQGGLIGGAQGHLASRFVELVVPYVEIEWVTSIYVALAIGVNDLPGQNEGEGERIHRLDRQHQQRILSH